MPPESIHVSVMPQEAVAALQPRDGGVYLDGTLGGGTQTQMLLEASAPSGRVISLDIDPEALDRARARFTALGSRWIGVEANFRQWDRVLDGLGIESVDGFLLDLGFSSDELARTDLGLSFQEDGPLDMRLGPLANEDGLTAAEMVNSWLVKDLEKVFRNFGEEPQARRFAEAIGEARRRERIVTTVQLRRVIHAVAPRRPQDRIDPATRVFQALRIIVNDELENLREALRVAERRLVLGGRVAVISFHSLEDRVVKQFFRDSAVLTPVSDGPMLPSETEVNRNPRARSAKLRVAERRVGA